MDNRQQWWQGWGLTWRGVESSCGWPSDWHRDSETGTGRQVKLPCGRDEALQFLLSHEKSVCEDEIFLPHSMRGWASRKKSQRAAKAAASCPTRPFEDRLPEKNWPLTNKAIIISSMEFMSFRKISPSLVQNLILRKLFSIPSVTVRQILNNIFNNIKNRKKPY